MTLDHYLDAIAFLEAIESDDLEALAHLEASANKDGMMAALVDIALGTGSTLYGTPGDSRAFLAGLRAQVIEAAAQ